MKADVLLGLQWGDEGKGKVVDVLTPDYDIVARFQGGPNAGHTLEFDQKHYVLRSVPSGIFREHQVNVIGNGVVLDPVLFAREVNELFDSGVDIRTRLKISRKAHLILPTHRLLDAAGEKNKGERKIGTTGKGIGPTYTDKISRTGIRVGDIERDFNSKYQSLKGQHLSLLGDDAIANLADAEQEWFKAIDFLKQFEFIDSEVFVNQALDSGKTILCEGAQGTMLDVDFGSYPFVTSSNTVCAGACTGLGVAPRRIGEVYGIFKAYCTRVGSGPFPTELNDNTGAEIRRIGHEFGAVTGRERRCGWLDLVALRYAIKINGVTKLIMMKSDVLDGFETIQVCDAYQVDGELTRDMPFDISNAKPVLTQVKGWMTDLTSITEFCKLPQAFVDYVNMLEQNLGVPICIISVGPDREQTIMR